MNRWIGYSIEYANQRSYLDDLFEVYPTIQDGIREIDARKWYRVKSAFEQKNDGLLIRELLRLDLFPIKDSYIAYLKRDKSAIERNPGTINRICGRLYDMGIDEIWKQCSVPKETNRQIGPMFKEWLRKKPLGIEPVRLEKFVSDKENAILDAGDQEMKDFAREELNYNHDKGLDFVARFNGKYIIGEAKFLTEFGGHQDRQFEDAIRTIEEKDVRAEKIAILDGVLYLKSKRKMHLDLTGKYNSYNIMSALVLRNFLYQL